MSKNNWVTYKMSDILEPVSLPVDLKSGIDYREIGIRSHGKGIFHKEITDAETIGNKRVFEVTPDALIFNIVFAWEQAVAKTSEKDKGFIASHRFPQYLPKDNLSDIDYLLYLFMSPKGKYLLNLASPGGAGRNKTLGKKAFDNLELKIPTITEQQKIVKILSTWDKAISTTERLIENSTQQQKALMQQLLTGKKRLLDDEGKRFEDEWEEVKLSEVAHITMGSSPKSEAYNHVGEGLPLLQGNADIKNRKSVPRIYTSQITKECHVDDILFSVRAPVGTVAISNHHACIGRGIASIKAKKNHSQEFLYQWLLAFELNWERYSQGSTFEAVNSNDIKSLNLSVPNYKEQQKIATVLTNADQEIELLEQQLADLQQEKKALMQQLLTGKKRVVVDE